MPEFTPMPQDAPFYKRFLGRFTWAELAANGFLLVCAFFLVVRQAWISEDAFITLRHVENLVSGHGPVFNVGERVEGFSHVLWFWIVSFFRWLGLPTPAAAVIPGLLFSFLFLYLLFFHFRFGGRSAPTLNFAAPVLAGISAFSDFATSGLETSLSYLLLILYGLLLARDRWRENPGRTGLVLACLVLNRPDFGIFLLLMLAAYAHAWFKKEIPGRSLLRFLAFPALLVGGYEIFRMGYYAALFPNTMYAKLGLGSYFRQGLKYALDFGQGSLAALIVLFALLGLVLERRSADRRNRFLLFASGLLHGFFVVREGGDFMHGRFLLPALVLLALSAAGTADRFLHRRKWRVGIACLLYVGFFFLSLWITPVQKRSGEDYHYRIFDDRYYYYRDRRFAVRDFFRTDLVQILRCMQGWEKRGLSYRDLAEKAGVKISVAYANIGFTGYYAGPDVYILDKQGLTDPVIARIRLARRYGRPGHEKFAPLGYLVMKRPTFCHSHYPAWEAEANIIPYGVLWDLTPSMLGKLAPFIGSKAKSDIDRNIGSFLERFDPATLSDRFQADFIFFLKHVWFPYAPLPARQRFEAVCREDALSRSSPAYRWLRANRAKVEGLYGRITGRLDLRKFCGNILFTLKSGFMKFDDDPQFNVIRVFDPTFKPWPDYRKPTNE